jgi:hypothetical protein
VRVAFLAALGFEGEGVLETCCEVASSWANASRGWLTSGVFASTAERGGTMVGTLVSITTRSGHL